MRRKVAEAYMSVILETRLTKEEIFELYCNQVYLGQLRSAEHGCLRNLHFGFHRPA
jgi:membrane carboxypeptidase/penicillin-binding protein